ncbi:urease accessory protein UreD [Sulfitobacter sp. EhC04]|uniref:urease accessory protein UreD n=1 Tax=Sulfitobacter sp. EhC04 TaxID=1849168 RepID=UPI000A753A75|nr:urease accessory protein UreD [Sulfitobacter sp. EhC04]
MRADAGGVTRLANLRQSGAMKLVLPRVFRPDVEAVIVNTAGGVTGGDRLHLDAAAGPGACLTLSTQAAERIYRAQPGEVGCIETRLTVAAGARVNWLPQETILFDHAALNRRLTVDLANDASLLMVETLVFGRAAMGEVLHAAHLRDRIRINRDGAPVYLDGIALDGDVQAHLARPAIAGGAGAVATLVFVSTQAEAQLGPLRALLPDTAAASLLPGGVLVARLLATDSFELRRTLIPALMLLNTGHLPMNWRL